MGAWGHGIFQSDKALDVRDEFLDSLKEKDMDSHSALAELEHKYALEMDDSEVAMVVAYLAVGFGVLTKDVKEKTIAAINEEITDRLDDWDKPEERHRKLEAFKAFLESNSTRERLNLDNI